VVSIDSKKVIVVGQKLVHMEVVLIMDVVIINVLKSG